MRIHDTEKLVARARSHARLDHIVQGTYGRIMANGKAKFQGCAIGCLSTPSFEEGLGEKMDVTLEAWRKTEYGGEVAKAYANGRRYEFGCELNAAGYFADCGISTADLLIATPEEQRQMLADEFGMAHSLVTLAEGLFEAQQTHGQAIEFVRNYAEALREGTWIDNEMVAAWINSRDFYRDEYGDRETFHAGGSDYEHITCGLEAQQMGDDDDLIEVTTTEALEWLGARCPA